MALPSALAGERNAIPLASAGNEGEECDRAVPRDGCIIKAAHAQCESTDFFTSVYALPPCVTRLSFSLSANPDNIKKTRWVFYDLWRANMSGLSELTELSITVDKESYEHIRLEVHPSDFFAHLQKLRVLSIRALQEDDIRNNQSRAIYQHLKHLQVLDLTRAKIIGLDYISFVLGPEPSVNTLILRNVQEFSVPVDIYSPTLDLSLFVCGGHVTYLDLSYNDFVNVEMSSPCWDSNLKHLRADHNFFAEYFADRNRINFMPIFSRLEYFHVKVESGQGYHEKLWQDEAIDEDIALAGRSNDEKTPTQPSLVSRLLQKLPIISAFAGYDLWLEDFMKHCGDFGYLDGVRCYAMHTSDLCDLFHCLSPQLNVTACQWNDNDSEKFEYISTEICSYKSCKFSIRLPMPPDLTTVVFQDFGTFGGINSAVELRKQYRNKTICLHPNNNLQVIDIRNIHFEQEKDHPQEFIRISGLHKLRYVNLQGHKLPFPAYTLVLQEAYSLTELHIGGGRLAQDDFLYTSFLQTYTQLKLLNLSRASLLGMEPDVFLVHKNLCVLDLSYNRLNASTLASVDISQTKLRCLNLSHNQLSSLPVPFRDQLDHMPGLQLYLSGNGFLCNCDNLAFLQWIQSSSSSIVFHYSGDHVCADSPGSTIHNIEIDSLHCDWYWVQPVLAAGCTLAASLLCLAIYALYKKRWVIANLIFRLRERLCVASDDDTSRSYSYDAFVLYSFEDEDRLWVHYKLVPELENIYGFRLCIHHRDFMGGCHLVDNIEAAIRRSRKVLVVMSPNFLRDNWRVEEVQMTMNEDRRKLIVIMYHDVLRSGTPTPPVVQRLLESAPCIEWDEAEEAQALFWKKTRRALYSKQMTYTEPTRPLILNPDDIALL